MAELTIAGWFATPIIEAIVHKAHSYITSHLHLHSCMEDDEELHALETTLTQILSAVSVAESRPIAHDTSHRRALLRQLKDAAYEAEDLLDEFGYLLLKATVESKIMLWASSSLGDKFRQKLKKILKKLDTVNASAERLLHVVGLENSSASACASISSAGATIQRREAVLRRATSSFLLENQVFGRDKERDEMFKLLLELDSQTGFVVSVIGDGGVGKTTLAQLVYNDRRVADRFDLRMWVCVSENFDESRLTGEILASAGDDANSCLFNLDKLQEQLKKKVMSKRFLLVLDDVWNDERIEEWEDKDRWRRLLAPLRFGGQGSKVIITTRLKMVARMLDAENSIHLKGLEEDHFWLLFTKYAFGSTQPDENQELQEVGKRIAERLKGSPLGAKVVGGMLNAETSVEKWKHVLRSEIWDGIMPVLRLSYRNLPSHLQRCFAYCSIFPKDWKFEPDRLIYMWMAQGFLRPEEVNNTRMEDIGRIYFFDLLSRSFFQILEHDCTTYYVMHDMIHDLARSVSKEECFRIEGSNAQKIPSTVRHLSINADVLPQLEKVCELKNLRTLAFFYSDHFVPSHVFRELRSIRVLDLTKCDMERLPKTVGRLIHLRYLALCDNLATLPSSLCRLYNLQVLNTSKWCWSTQLPQSMNKLRNLRHLNVRSAFVSQIAGIGKLTSLQGLVEFHVRRKKGHRIVELKDMNELRELLEIKNLENVKSKTEAVEAKLNQKEHIRFLTLEWGFSEKAARNNDAVLEGLQPHPNLERLDIIRYYGINSPSWLEINWLVNLKSLILTNCKFWVSLPPLGQLPSLRVLKISGMKAVKQISSEFYGSGNLKGFLKLEYLKFECMPNLLEWHGVEEYPLFPSLRDLEIKRCEKLAQIPTSFAVLANMSIGYVGSITNLNFSSSSSPNNLFTLNVTASTIRLDSYLDRHLFGAIDVLYLHMLCQASVSTKELQAFTSLRQLKLSCCHQLVISETPNEEPIYSILPPSLIYLNIDSCRVTDEELSCCLQNLTRLSTLEITSCHQFASLPSAPILYQLTTLKVLHIKNCNKLVSLGGLHVLTSLTELILTHCPNALALTVSKEDDNCTGLLPSSLTSLEINSCGLVDSLLSKCLQNLASLTTLKIDGCHQLTSLLPSTSVMCQLTALKHLSIRCCPALTSLGGLQNLSSLKMLRVFNCPQLMESVNTQDDGDDILPSSIESLELHSCGVNNNSLSLCLQNLTSLSNLSIEGCNNITSLPPAAVMCSLTALEELSIDDCKELTSASGLTALINLRCLNIERCFKLNSMALLADLKSISSLKDLNIMDGLEIQSLPDNGLPPSLEYFSLLQCHPGLKKQIIKKEGPEWDKISHVSQIICRL